MEPPVWVDFRNLLGQLSWVGVGSRPDILAQLGEPSERVNYLNRGLFVIKQLPSRAKGAVDLYTFRFPETIGVATEGGTSLRDPWAS